MTSSNLKRAGRLIAAGMIIAALGGCAMLDAAKARHARKSVPTRAMAAQKIAQLSYGASARYAVCSGAACPRVTRKTLVVPPPPPPAPSAAEVPVAGAWPALAERANACPPRGTPPGREAVAIRLADDQPAPGGIAGSCSADGTGSAIVLFAHNDAELDLQAKLVIDRIVRRASKASAILVTGYTDSVGNTQANRKLAALRAANVRDYLELMSPGVADKTKVQAKGACCFVASNGEESGRAMNRRVQIDLDSASGMHGPESRRKDRRGQSGAQRQPGDGRSTPPPPR